MLLGIAFCLPPARRGDNTFSNYQEAQRAFWRQTVLPLVNLMTQGFSKWLAPGFGYELQLRPDLDQAEALAPERGELWARLQSVSFLTDDEKRAVIGYESVSPAPGDSPSFAPSDSPAGSRPEGAGVGPGAVKFNPYHDELGRFTFADGAGGGGPGGSLTGGPSSVGLGGNGKPAASGDSGDRVAMGKVPKIIGNIFRQTPKVLRSSEKPLHELLKPGGKEIGQRLGSARPGIRTVTKEEFQKLKAETLEGASETPARPDYLGKWYRRPDGSIIGVRLSPKHGETLEVVKSIDKTILENGYKVHHK